MFCREQVAQLRGHLDAIRAKGAELVVVGNGTAKMAAAFRKDFGVEVPLLVDPGLKAYGAAGLKRGFFTVMNPAVLARGARTMAHGFKQGSMQGDAFQQGGAFVIDKGGAVRYAFVSDGAGHHPPPEELVAALP
jgi:peroxiredoxin